MTVLSGQSIEKREIFSPFCRRTKAFGMTYGLGPAGYDVRIAESVLLPPGGFALASILEHMNMPIDVVACVHDKSTWARMGLALQNTIIEPGWRGYLTIELSNHGHEDILLGTGMPIAQIVISMLDQPTLYPYGGKYQDQQPGAQLPLFE